MSESEIFESPELESEILERFDVRYFTFDFATLHLNTNNTSTSVVAIVLELVIHHSIQTGSEVNTLTVGHLVSFKDFHTKTTGSHMALRTCNSGTGSIRELFKGSKDGASLLVCT